MAQTDNQTKQKQNVPQRLLDFFRMKTVKVLICLILICAIVFISFSVLAKKDFYDKNKIIYDANCQITVLQYASGNQITVSDNQTILGVQNAVKQLHFAGLITHKEPIRPEDHAYRLIISSEKGMAVYYISTVTETSCLYGEWFFDDGRLWQIGMDHADELYSFLKTLFD